MPSNSDDLGALPLCELGRQAPHTPPLTNAVRPLDSTGDAVQVEANPVLAPEFNQELPCGHSRQWHLYSLHVVDAGQLCAKSGAGMTTYSAQAALSAKLGMRDHAEDIIAGREALHIRGDDLHNAGHVLPHSDWQGSPAALTREPTYTRRARSRLFIHQRDRDGDQTEVNDLPMKHGLNNVLLSRRPKEASRKWSI